MASIPFRNNEAIIELISKKPLGLMIILEDQVMTQTARYRSDYESATATLLACRTLDPQREFLDLKCLYLKALQRCLK